MSNLQRDRIRYYIKKPGTGRASFGILKDVKKANGTRVSEKVTDDRIDRVNKAYHSGLREKAVCEIEIRNIIEDLYRKERLRDPAYLFNEDNLKLLEQYWEAEYALKENVDLQSARNDLLRAIEAVGSLSLLSASREDLQKAIDKNFKGNRQRRRVSRLNQLLKFHGAPFKLRKAPRERTKIRYLNEADFRTVIKRIESQDLRNFFVTCFSTGARTGEAFAIDPHEIHDDVVSITKQMYRSGAIGSTKNRRERQVVSNPFGRQAIVSWARHENRENMRNLKLGKLFKAACVSAFPNKKEKWCTTHDLRHSYAIWLLSKGVSLSLVAQSLGDSISVCQEYYAGFVLTPDSIHAIKSILGKSA